MWLNVLWFSTINKEPEGLFYPTFNSIISHLITAKWQDVDCWDCLSSSFCICVTFTRGMSQIVATVMQSVEFLLAREACYARSGSGEVLKC